MKKRVSEIIEIITMLVILILEILPYGVVLNFSHVTEDGSIDLFPKYYSYFDLMPFGYAHFTPLIIAVLTCLLIVLYVVKLIKKNVLLDYIVIGILIFIVLLSILPILIGYGITIINVFVIILIGIVLILNFLPKKV